MSDPTVSIVRCTSYEPEPTEAAVREALEAVPETNSLLQPGARVLLKPNLLSARDRPESAVNTHPAVIRALALYCRQKGCEVAIGDSCGSLSSGSTKRALKVAQVPQIAEEVGAEVLDFDRQERIEVEVAHGEVLHTVTLAQPVVEADVLIGLPKMKTHGLTTLTGAVKNQFGCMPGRLKKDTHLEAPNPDTMSRALVDVYSAARPDLVVMDGIQAMEGHGPVAGQVRDVGLLLAADDAVAMDAVFAHLVGRKPEDVATTLYAAERGLGIAALASIQTVGVPLGDARMADFDVPGGLIQSHLLKIIPDSVVRWMFNQWGATRPAIMDDECILCGQCVANCPAGALKEKDGHIEVNPERCIGCYCCTEVCDQRAITMKRSLLGRLFGGGEEKNE